MTKPSSPDRPLFVLRRIYRDGSQQARFCSLNELLQSAASVHVNRRTFLSISGLSMAAALAACSSSEPGDRRVTAPGTTDPEAPIVEMEAPSIEEVANLAADSLACSELRAHSAAILGLAFSPDSRRLASLGDDQTIKLWDLAAGGAPQLVDDQPEETAGSKGAPSAPIFSQDGKQLYWLWPQFATLNIYDLDRGVIVDQLEGFGGLVWCAAFNHDETRLVVAGQQWIEVWDFRKKRRLWSSESASQFLEVLFSGDGESIFSSGVDGLILQWDAESGQILDEIANEHGMPLGLAISPDGSQLCWGGNDANLATIWDIASRKTIDVFNAPGAIATLTAFSPDGRWLAVSGGWGDIRIVDAATRLQESKNIHLLESQVRALWFSSDSRYLALGSETGTITLWRIEDLDFINEQPDLCLFDPAAAPAGEEYNTVQAEDEYGIIRSYTLPCGSPIPAGAVCTCNCVPGTFAGELPSTSGNQPSTRPGGSGCSCNQVCTCVPVCVCMAV